MRLADVVRVWLVTVVVCSMLLVLAVAVSAPSYTPRPPELRTAGMTDGSRVTRGLDGLRVDTGSTAECARQHSRRMADRGTVFHSGCPGRAENVGYSFSLSQIQRAWWNSTPHRRNLLGGWQRQAVGVVQSNGKWFVTVIFA